MANIPATASKRTYREGSEFTTPNPVIVAGSFEIADDADPTNVRGEGFSVTEGAAEGQFIITFATAYPMLIAAVPGYIDTDAADDDVVVTFETYNATAGTMVIKVSKESTGTLAPDDTNTAGKRIAFVCVFHKRNALAVTYTS